MIYYKVRRKADGKFARNSTDCLYGAYGKSAKSGKLPSGWGVGQVYSEKAFLDIRRLYNQIGGPQSRWNSKTREYEPEFPIKPGSSGLMYKDIELVKYGPTGEVIVWTDTRCTLSPEEAKKFIPTGTAPLTLEQKRAGIIEEVGVLLEEIDSARNSIANHKQFDLEGLFSRIEIKKMRLRVAADELNNLQDIIKDDIKKAMGLDG